jgi:hypothetical protein
MPDPQEEAEREASVAADLEPSWNPKAVTAPLFPLYLLDFIGEPRWIRTIDPLIKSKSFLLSSAFP